MVKLATRSMILQANAELAALNCHIDNVTRHLQSLTERRDLYEQTLLDRITPIRSVPLEILQRIMRMALDIPEDEANALPLSSRERESWDAVETYEPWPLSQVCQLFRYAALSYPRMWSHIRWKSFRNTRSGIERFKTYLNRSASCPLNVEIRGYISDRTFRNEAFDALLQTSERWVALLVEYREAKASSLLMPLRDNLPNLRHLCVMCGKNISFSDPSPFRCAPKPIYLDISVNRKCMDLSGASIASLFPLSDIV
jgi:hypothetical protein